MTYDAIGKLDKRVPEITAEVNAGKMVWHKYDCIGCHTIFGNGSYFIDPEAVNPKASMPKFGITAVEADGLLAFFDWPAKVDTNGWPPKHILAGAAGSGRGRELSAG
jgi:nitric oxide reductase subunit C